MQNSGTSPGGKKMSASQLNGFVVKRHRVPPLSTEPNASAPGQSETRPSASEGLVLPRIDSTPNKQPVYSTLKPAKQKSQPSLKKFAEASTDESNVANQPGNKEREHYRAWSERKETVSMSEEKLPAPSENSKEEGGEAAKSTAQGKKEEPTPEKPNDTGGPTNDREKDKLKKTKAPTKDWRTEGEEKIERYSETFAKTPQITRSTADGTYTKDFVKQLQSLSFAYSVFRSYPLELKVEFRKKIADVMLGSGSLAVICETLTEEFSNKPTDPDVVKDHQRAIRIIFSVLLNYSDIGDKVTHFMRDHPSFLQSLLDQVKKWTPLHLQNDLGHDETYQLITGLGVLHNIAMRDDNVIRLQEMHTTPVLMPLLESQTEEIKLSVYATLADVVSEEEADKLATSPKQARFLLNWLKIALRASDRRCRGWSVTELVRAVRQLSRNDANKKLMADEGAIPLMTLGIQSAIEEERSGCMETLWVLSFNAEVGPEIVKHEDLLDAALKIYEDHSQPKSMQKSAHGFLWQLRDELSKIPKYSNMNNVFTQRRQRTKASFFKAKGRNGKVAAEKEEDKTEGHIMLSYQWADQQMVMRIRDILRQKGFKVWMDIDYMGGSTLQAMAAAIEEAFLVVSCMSHKYKDSPNCRAEAEYAFQQRKKIVPLIMQQGYRPDGWLGLILGAKLYYDFSGKYPFQSRIDLLLKAVKEAKGQKGDTVDGKQGTTNEQYQPEVVEEPVIARSVQPLMHGAPSRAVPAIDSDSVKKWMKKDVKNWLKKFNLDGTELERLTGNELVFLHGLRMEAPEYFYNTLEKKLQIRTLTGLISFIDALNDLPPA